MKKKDFIFLFFNAIIISILWLLASSGFIYIHNDFLQIISISAGLLAAIITLGGEFILSTIYSYKSNFTINLKIILLFITLNIIIIKLLVTDIYMSLIIGFCINQILGLSFGNLLLKKKINSSS